MGQPYVGEIRMFAGNFAPAGWMFCEGQLLPISENETLFNLIGTTYGGDGQSTFGLPDLRGRIPLHMGQGPGLSAYTPGEMAGVEQVTLTVSQIPNHSHLPQSNTESTQVSPGNGLWASSTKAMFSAGAPNANMAAQAIAPDGGSQPHTNFMPYLCVDFIISLFGIYPPHQ